MGGGGSGGTLLLGCVPTSLDVDLRICRYGDGMLFHHGVTHILPTFHFSVFLRN